MKLDLLFGGERLHAQVGREGDSDGVLGRVRIGKGDRELALGMGEPRFGVGLEEITWGTSSQASFTVTNCGNAPLNISNVQLTSPIFALSPTSSCVAAVTTLFPRSLTGDPCFTAAAANILGAIVCPR
jgi:hypothetical protein